MRGVRVYASPGALEEAARLLPGRPIENVVEDAIHSGNKRRVAPAALEPLGRGERCVFLGNDGGAGGVVARLRRARSPLGGRPAWLVVRVVRVANTTIPKRRDP